MTGNALTPFLPPQDEYRRTVDLAQRLASTAFVPSALRGKPDEVLAAMLVGRELGIGALEALRSIHVIEGKPTESAELLHALVLRAGHDLWVAESTDTRAEVRYRRSSWPKDRRDGVVVWTIERAQVAGLTGKAVWSKYPAAMLRSRAVSEGVRQGFPDVVKGAGFVTEELDGPDQVVEEQAAGTVSVQHVERVDAAPDPSDLDAAEGEVETDEQRRRALYQRAVRAYNRLRADDPPVAAAAWEALAIGLPGATAADVFRTADPLVLEQRVVDLEATADDDGHEPDDGTPAEPVAPSGDGSDGQGADVDDNGDPIVDAEVVDDEGDVSNVYVPPEPDPDPEPEPEAEHDPLEQTVAAAVAEAEAAYPHTTVVQVIALLKGDPVEVDGNGERWTVDLGALDTDARRELVWRLEREAFTKPRRTVRAQVEPRDTSDTPRSSQDAREAAEGDGGPVAPGGGSTAQSGDQGLAPAILEHPDGMDPREWSTRVALWRRFEAVLHAAKADEQLGRVMELRQLQARHVGSSPAGALFVPIDELEALAVSAEQLAARA